MKRILAFSILILTLTSCGEDSTNKTKRISVYQLDFKNDLSYYNNKLFNGIGFANQKDGELWVESFIENGKTVKHKWYNENGTLWYENILIDGKGLGLFNVQTTYYTKTYYENGNLKRVDTTKQNKNEHLNHGICERYYINGKLKIKEQFKLGELISKSCFKENGDNGDCEIIDRTCWDLMNMEMDTSLTVSMENH